MLNFPNITQIEALFSEMEPANLAGESFTPSLHTEEIVLEDIPPEPEEDEEVSALAQSRLGQYTAFFVSEIPVSLAAIDAGVVDLGISRTGFALAFKGAVVLQDLDGTHSITKIGPRIKFITPDNKTDLLHFIGQQLTNEYMFVEVGSDGALEIKAGSTEPNQFKDRIRNFIERMLQLDIAQQLQNGILLIDGALTLRTYNTPRVFLERLGREVAQRNSDIIGISKKSRLTIDGVHISALLDDAPADAGFQRILIVDTRGSEADAASRNLGVPFAVRFSPGGFTFRTDVARRSLIGTEEELLNTLYANTYMCLGYPNLLRLAHIHSAFTKAEIVSLQVQVAHDYGVSMRQPEDLSVIFAPFRKGIGG